jgi:bacteriocin propeptide, TIGR03798 family
MLSLSQTSGLTPGRDWAILEVLTPRPLNPMSEAQLKAFLEAVKADAGLQEKLKEAADAEAVLAIAKAAGFVISVEEFNRLQVEVSEEELEGAAGGGFTNVLRASKEGVAGCWWL